MGSDDTRKQQQTLQWMVSSFPDHEQLRAWRLDEKNAVLSDISSFLHSEWPPMDGTECHRGAKMVQLDMYTHCCLLFKRHDFFVDVLSATSGLVDHRPFLSSLNRELGYILHCRDRYLSLLWAPHRLGLNHQKAQQERNIMEDELASMIIPNSGGDLACPPPMWDETKDSTGCRLEQEKDHVTRAHTLGPRALHDDGCLLAMIELHCEEHGSFTMEQLRGILFQNGWQRQPLLILGEAGLSLCWHFNAFSGPFCLCPGSVGDSNCVLPQCWFGRHLHSPNETHPGHHLDVSPFVHLEDVTFFRTDHDLVSCIKALLPCFEFAGCH